MSVTDQPAAGGEPPAPPATDTVDPTDTEAFEDEFSGDDWTAPTEEQPILRDAGDGVPPAPQVVVFDIGEVLIDETRVWSVWAEILGVSPLSFAAVLGAAIVQGEDHHSTFAHIAPNFDWREFEDEHERRYGGFRDEDLYADVRPCLDELVGMGITVAIAGNQPARRREQLRALALNHAVLATSEDLGHDKPDPAFFAAVLDAVGVADASQVLYVGDRIDNDVLPAEAFGMRTCWLRRGPWGQLQDIPEDHDADLVLDGLGELPLLIAEWRDETTT